MKRETAFYQDFDEIGRLCNAILFAPGRTHRRVTTLYPFIPGNQYHGMEAAEDQYGADFSGIKLVGGIIHLVGFMSDGRFTLYYIAGRKWRINFFMNYSDYTNGHQSIHAFLRAGTVPAAYYTGSHVAFEKDMTLLRMFVEFEDEGVPRPKHEVRVTPLHSFVFNA